MQNQEIFPPQATSNFFQDLYQDDQPAGRVIGTKSTTGVIRKGIDTEGIIAIDNGALRLQPLIKPGWGRQGIAYGPYERANGLALAVFLVNGHNTSQTGSINSLIRQILRWMKVSEEKTLRWLLNLQKFRWLLGLLSVSNKQRIIRRIKYWANNRQKLPRPAEVYENLAVGWFPQEVPSDPCSTGNAFIVHAADSENGELWTHVGSNLLSAVKGLQNVQIYYIIILREKGAAYYAASVSNAYGLGSYPNMRPIAIDPFHEDENVYASVYQSVQGEIGFWVDTRVYGTQVQQIPPLSTWYGTAHGADRLIGNGLLGDSQTEIGGLWTIYKGSFSQTEKGAVPVVIDSLAVLNPGNPSGLVHLILETSDNVTTANIIWRFQDEENFWSLSLGADKCQLIIRSDGISQSVAVSDEWYLQPNSIYSLQILDEGQKFSLYLNGKLLFANCFIDTRLNNGTGVGIGAVEANTNLFFRDFEAHSSSIPIPTELDCGSPWVAEGTQVVVSDDFGSGIFGDLAGKTTNTGDSTEGNSLASRTWRKEMGRGSMQLTGNGSVKVLASVQKPNPGRTVYTVSWVNPEFADVQVDITPPGSKRGQGEKGRGGLIFWQDSHNYMIINNWVDDSIPNSPVCGSISSFFCINGFEDVYDAVWTNVGNRLCWGITHTLRVVFDGMNYTAFINDEPVLYRCLRDVYPDCNPLAINRIGIVANWEWGDDTGSIFTNFQARK
ncbi:MAG: hypothetical protein QNJ63_27395 [Calothrix sp. MO_192.B10]|nr:hypothetical protein [Calothrix sp. MO_192.B10]